MKYALWIFLTLYSVCMVIACGGSNSGGLAATPQAAQVGCPIGSTFINGGCYGQNNLLVSNGIAFKTDNFDLRNMNVANSSIFRNFLKETLAVCDRADITYGTANCDAYLSGYAQIILQTLGTNASAARLTIEVQPRIYNYNSYGYSTYYASLPNAGQAATCGITWLLTGYCMTYPTANQMQVPRNPLALDLTVSVINNSQGFEGRAYGAQGTISQNHLIQFMVPNGKLQDASFDYQLAYRGQSQGTFLTGRMARCNDAGCGVYYY
jgi:hypothetical protein